MVSIAIMLARLKYTVDVQLSKQIILLTFWSSIRLQAVDPNALPIPWQPMPPAYRVCDHFLKFYLCLCRREHQHTALISVRWISTDRKWSLIKKTNSLAHNSEGKK